MQDIIYRDRETGTLKKEKVYGKVFLHFLYSKSLISKVIAFFLLPLIARLPWVSFFYGRRQKNRKSRGKIVPFIRNFAIDMTECLSPVDAFESFNDFFIRKLKPEARPIASGESLIIFPADGRHLVFPDLSKVRGVYVKGKIFDLDCLLKDRALAQSYQRGSMLVSRLCPTDYHRYHFPCGCIPGEPKQINGALFSVNPLALKRHITILNENKRVITLLEAGKFGRIAYIEVGATCVGSIEQTFTPHHPYQKGEEKGYFEFGGSCLILLFQPNRVTFDQDLIDASAQHLETYAKMGTPLGILKRETVL